MSIKEEIAGDIDNHGLWNWLCDHGFRRYADKIPLELLQKLIKCSYMMQEVREELEKEGYIILW